MAVTLALTGVSGSIQPGSLLRRITWFRAAFLALAAPTAALHGAAAYRLWQVHDHAIVGCENADGCRRVLRHQGVDFGIGTPRVVVE